MEFVLEPAQGACPVRFGAERLENQQRTLVLETSSEVKKTYMLAA